MAAVLTQDTLDERGEQGQRRRLGQYQRFLLVPLIVLAFFGAVSLAAPKEAQADHGSGWHWTNLGGTEWECWWDYHGYDYYGNEVWTTDGCLYYYGGDSKSYYMKSTGQRLMTDAYGNWIDVTDFWSNSPLTNQISASWNRAGLLSFINSSTAAQLAPHLRASSSQASSTMGSEAPSIQGSEAPSVGSEAPPTQGSETSTASEASTMATSFPWVVSQDRSASMTYGATWRQYRSSKAQGGTYRMSSSRITGAFFAAEGDTDAGGSTMKLFTKTGPKMGTAKVLVVNLADATVVKEAYFNLRSRTERYRVAKSITGLTPHQPYGLIVLSANGRPVAVDAVGYEAHGNMCHNVIR